MKDYLSELNTGSGCWTKITLKDAELDPALKGYVGEYLVLEGTDMLVAGKIVPFSEIRRQLDAWAAECSSIGKRISNLSFSVPPTPDE